MTDDFENPVLLGSILVNRGIISRRQLREAAAQALATEGMRLGDAVVERGYASREDVELAYERQRLMKAKSGGERNATAHSVIDLAEAQSARLADKIGNAYDRADAVVRRFGRRRKTGGA